MFGDDNDDIIEQLFESLLQKYEENLQNKMRGSEFEFDGVNFLYYDFNKTSINRGISYIDSPKWLKDKKSTINPKNNDDKCFQYAVTLALNLDKIKKDPRRVSKIKPFIEKYNWENIDFPSTSKDWKNFECNNEVALNVLDVPYNTKKINIAYKSKKNLIQKRQIILLMISDGQKWQHLINLGYLLAFPLKRSCGAAGKLRDSNSSFRAVFASVSLSHFKSFVSCPSIKEGLKLSLILVFEL